MEHLPLPIIHDCHDKKKDIPSKQVLYGKLGCSPSSKLVNGEENNADKNSISVKEKQARDVWLDKLGMQNNVVPKFENYSDVQSRLKSFDTCSNQNLKISALCEAGFFYHGKNDCTICFHCGGGLKEWKETDDPWIEHAYWFPRCHFVMTMRGKQFIDSAWGRKQELDSPEGMKQANDALKELIDMLKTKNKKPITKSPQSAEVSVVSSELNDESPDVCKICFLEERNTMFIPCRHIVVCSRCAALLKKCVVCRGNIQDTVRVFLS